MKNKKGYLFFVLALALSMVLGACNQEATTGESKKEEKKEASLSIDEVMEKAFEANKDLKSLSIKLDTKTKATDGGETMNINTGQDMNIIFEPIAMYAKTNINIVDEEEIHSESYFTDKGFYSNVEDKWIKMPNDSAKELLSSMEGQANPIEQLEKLESFTDDITLEEDSKSFILTLKGKDENFRSLIEEQYASLSTIMPDGLGDFTINNLEYSYHIDKKTYHLTGANFKASIKIKMNTTDVTMDQEGKMTLSNLNGIDKITVPKDVVNSALEVRSIE